jgi:hypothetical protein
MTTQNKCTSKWIAVPMQHLMAAPLACSQTIEVTAIRHGLKATGCKDRVKLVAMHCQALHLCTVACWVGSNRLTELCTDVFSNINTLGQTISTICRQQQQLCGSSVGQNIARQNNQVICQHFKCLDLLEMLVTEKQNCASAADVT